MQELDSYPVKIERPVSWGDMDAFQHVNNVRYFRFFEDARIAYFEAIEIYDPEAPNAFGSVGPILAATSCRFKAPLTYPDDVVIGARTTDIESDRLIIEYAVASTSAGRIVAVGDSEVVSYDYEKAEKVPIPQAWRAAVDAVE